MIAVDTNILVYAHRTESVWHAKAYESLASLAEGVTPWAIPVHCLHEFLAIVTNAKIFSAASTYRQAIDQIDGWLESPTLRVLHGGQNHWFELKKLGVSGKLKGGQYHDARIAATCIENGVTQLWSADRDFRKFTELRVFNPLSQ